LVFVSVFVLVFVLVIVLLMFYFLQNTNCDNSKLQRTSGGNTACSFIFHHRSLKIEGCTKLESLGIFLSSVD
jgi:hypothetical protein